MTDGKPNVVFLCVANSCRSQMAEAFLNKYAGDRFEVHSAGLDPADRVHPMAVRVMNEVGLDVSGSPPEPMQKYLGQMAVRYVIIVCAVTAERCPRTWPGISNRLLWPFEDPAELEGTEEEKLAKFREVRDKIDRRIRQWVDELEGAGEFKEANEQQDG
jgi:arsenate reductase